MSLCDIEFEWCEGKSGLGYKIVRYINETTFAPEWSLFRADGLGGVCGTSRENEDEVYVVNDVYKLYHPTKINHTRIAKYKHGINGESRSYWAGIHLYRGRLVEQEATDIERELRDSIQCITFESENEHKKRHTTFVWLSKHKYALIRCYYSGGICQDRNMVVAQSIVPVEVVRVYDKVNPQRPFENISY